MIEILKVFKPDCPLCRSVSQRLYTMEKEYKNLRVIDYSWGMMKESQQKFYTDLGVTRVPFIIVLDFNEKVEKIVQDKLILTGFTPSKLKEQIEEKSGEKLVPI